MTLKDRGKRHEAHQLVGPVKKKTVVGVTRVIREKWVESFWATISAPSPNLTIGFSIKTRPFAVWITKPFYLNIRYFLTVPDFVGKFFISVKIDQNPHT